MVNLLSSSLHGRESELLESVKSALESSQDSVSRKESELVSLHKQMERTGAELKQAQDALAIKDAALLAAQVRLQR